MYICSLSWFIFLKVLGSEEDSALEEGGEKPAKKKKTDGSAKISTRASYTLSANQHFLSVLPRPFLQGAAPCSFLVTPCPF